MTKRKRLLVIPAKTLAWGVWWDGWGEHPPAWSDIFPTKKRAREHIQQMGVATPYTIHRVQITPITEAPRTRGRRKGT